MKNDPTIVPAKILKSSHLVVTITFNATPGVDEPYRLTVVKNNAHEMGYWDFESFADLTEFLDQLCDEACAAFDEVGDDD